MQLSTLKALHGGREEGGAGRSFGLREVLHSVRAAGHGLEKRDRARLPGDVEGSQPASAASGSRFGASFRTFQDQIRERQLRREEAKRASVEQAGE